MSLGELSRSVGIVGWELLFDCTCQFSARWPDRITQYCPSRSAEQWWLGNSASWLKKLDMCIMRNHSLVLLSFVPKKYDCAIIVQKSWTEWIQWIALFWDMRLRDVNLPQVQCNIWRQPKSTSWFSAKTGGWLSSGWGNGLGMSRAFDLDRQSKECWNSGLQRRAQQEQVIQFYKFLTCKGKVARKVWKRLEKSFFGLVWLGREHVQQVFRRPYLAHVGWAVPGCCSSRCCCCIVYFEARKELHSNLAPPGVMFFWHLFKQLFTHVRIHSAGKVQERCRKGAESVDVLVAFGILWVSSCSGSQEGQEGEKSIYFSYHLIEPSTRQDGCNMASRSCPESAAFGVSTLLVGHAWGCTT